MSNERSQIECGQCDCCCGSVHSWRTYASLCRTVRGWKQCANERSVCDEPEREREWDTLARVGVWVFTKMGMNFAVHFGGACDMTHVVVYVWLPITRIYEVLQHKHIVYSVVAKRQHWQKYRKPSLEGINNNELIHSPQFPSAQHFRVTYRTIIFGIVQRMRQSPIALATSDVRYGQMGFKCDWMSVAVELTNLKFTHR